jgi:poly-beta-1,6-N-acetyl-D-glucosamine biosynthesis protein PgaD
MRTLILDRYNQQSLLKRFLWNTLTGLGWGFWIYLWLPLFAAITLLLSPHPEQATSAASNSILALLATLTAHASTVVIMIAAFFAWSLLQWVGKHYRREALQKQHENAPSSATHTVQNVRRWRQVQCMVVSHDDANGFIQGIELLKPKHRALCQELPQLSKSLYQPSTLHPVDFIAKRVHR